MKFNFIGFGVLLFLAALGKVLEWLGWPTAGLVAWTLALVVVGVGLYRVRERGRLVYGLFEFVVATVGGFLVLRSISMNSQGLADGPLVVRMAILFASVYVTVRALDNIGVGLKGMRLETWWKEKLLNGGTQ